MGKKFRNTYRVNSTRFIGYDYSQDGNYFITVCSYNRQLIFGEIVNVGNDKNANGGCTKIKLSNEGKIVYDCWYDLPNHYPNIVLDEFVVMPNHIHGIIIIRNNPNQKIRHGIPEFIRAFKSFSSRRINELNNKILVETGLRPVSTLIWQSRYYDHIIRSQHELNIIRSYVKKNPENFQNDKFT